jgi:hypothetical protein
MGVAAMGDDATMPLVCSSFNAVARFATFMTDTIRPTRLKMQAEF